MSKTLEKELIDSINTEFDKIIKKYPETDIEKIWKSVCIKISKNLKTEKTPENTENDTQSNSSGCIYKYIKGIQKNEICGSKTKDEKKYCSKHKKYEGTVVNEEIKVSPITKETKQTIKPTAKKINAKEIKPVQRLFSKHQKTGKLWHSETGLTLKSGKDRFVIGKIVDDVMLDLTEEDIELCKKWRFALEKKEEKKEENSDNDE
jgi:hypothetical protein